MNIREAATLRVKAQAESDTFTEACSTQEEDIKDALEGVVGIFKNVLTTSRAEAIVLRDGGYLYMRSSTSTRAINEPRIASAIQAITVGQLKRLSEDDAISLAEILCVAIDENLEDECITVSYAPNVAKRKPSTLKDGATCQNSTPAVEKAVAEYRKLKEKLGLLRKHRSGGRKRVTEVKEQTEPILLAHMQEQGAKRQRIDLLPVETEPESSPEAAPDPLPPLPVLLPTHQDGPSAAQAMTVVVPDCEPKTYQLQRRTYTSRGKAPALKKFSDSLKQCVAPAVQSSTINDATLRRWASEASKNKLIELVVTHYNALFAASKGVQTEKLTLKCVA